MKAAGKRLPKPLFIVLAVVAFLALLVFAGWYLFPQKKLDIVLLDKTVVPGAGKTQQDADLAYRKQIGFFWMLSDLRYASPLTGRAYDYKKDYYGTHLDQKGGQTQRDLLRLDRTPDMVYLSDTYGSDTQSGGEAGLSYSDIAVAASAHLSGATLVGESDIVSSTADSVRQEIHDLFGFTYTDWVGRYFADLRNTSDIPDWAMKLQQQQYGRVWDYKGEGLLLVSRKDELIVLQQGVDFTQNPLTVQIAPAFQSKFGKLSANYYNWFEIINSDYGTDVVAQYQLHLNKTGLSKFSKVAASTVFPAVTRLNSGRAPAYYFAGDFNDCVGWNKYTNFLGAGTFYNLFSFDRKGDISNFYWKFYRPLMGVITDDCYRGRARVTQPKVAKSAAARIRDNRFEVLQGKTWTPVTLKSFAVNASMPGDASGVYTRDFSVYQQFLSEIAGAGGNCVYAKDLLPPEFYRALVEYNAAHGGKPLYFIQSIGAPAGVSAKDDAGSDVQALWKKGIETAVDAVHGKATVAGQGAQSGDPQSAKAYINDASPWLLGYVVDAGLDADAVRALNQGNPGYRYEGAYLSADGSCAEAVEAMLCDTVYSYQQKQYGYLTPVGAHGEAELLQGFPWSPQDASGRFDAGALRASDKAKDSFFVSYELDPSASYFLNNTAAFAGYADAQGAFAFGGWVRAVKAAETACPLLIDGMGLPTNADAFEKETSVNGLSESDQGNGLVRMLKAAADGGCLGAVIRDLNDQWSAVSEQTGAYTIPQKDKPLWQDALDPLQNTGVLAVEPTPPAQAGMTLKDSGLMQEMQLSADEKYLYVTVVLNREIQYDSEQLFLGLDTYQRNDGEYRYDPAYFATSLSGMEYVVKFDSKSSAGLYVVPAYDRGKGAFASAESYTGAFDYVAALKYGSFDTSDGEMYQTGSILHVRIPWGMLNFTDPSQKIVLNDSRTQAQAAADPFGLKTAVSDGVLVSVLVANKASKDTEYVFPESKQSDGYKLFTWEPWKTAAYQLREKESYGILKNYFTAAQ